MTHGARQAGDAGDHLARIWLAFMVSSGNYDASLLLRLP